MSRALLLLALVFGPGARAEVPSEAVARLRTFCVACHGLGELRFLYSHHSDEEAWTYLFENRSPASGRLWSEAIYDVLNWPSDAPPPFGQLMKPPDRDWMPKGKKRLDLAADQVGGTPTRRYLLDALRSAMAPDGNPVQ